MRPPRDPSNPQARLRALAVAHGFTLIELLVVVVIIGIVSTGVLLATGLAWRDRELEEQGERLFALTAYAREQAELQTREFGLFCDEHGYEFLVFDPRRDAWRSVMEDEVLRARELPEGLRLRLAVEGREVVLRRPSAEQEEEKMPHVMIFSNGDLTPFRLTIERDDMDRSITIASDEQGQIELHPIKEGSI